MERESDLLTDLKTLAGNGPHKPPETRSRTELFPVLATLRQASAFGPACLEPLRGIYLGCVLQPHLGDVQVGSSHLANLGSAIRAIEIQSKADHPLLGELRKATGRTSPSELAKLFSDSPAVDGLPRDWARVFSPWLKRLEVPQAELTEGPPSSSPGPNPPSQQQAKRKPRENAERERPKTLRIAVPDVSPTTALEIGDDGAAQIEFVVPEELVAAKPPKRAAEDSAYALRGIRQQNSQQLTSHIEVYGAQERREVTVALMKLSEGHPCDAFEAYRDSLLTLLVDVSGFQTKLLGQASVGGTRAVESAAVHFDVLRGLMVIPVMRPDRKTDIPLQARPLFEQSTLDLPLTLPVEIASRLRTLFEYRPVNRLGDWFVGADLDEILDDTLDRLDIPDISKDRARLRRSHAAHLHEVTRDPATTMLVAYDTSSFNKSSLHYYKPRCSDLQKPYNSSTSFIGAHSELPVDESDLRVGGAHLLKRDAARAGISEVCNSLNCRARAAEAANPRSAAIIHKRLVNVLIFLIALICGHRPHESLFKLRRYSFSQRALCAILDDKRIDAAHCHRLVAITKALADQIDLYLLHLLALSEQPWAIGAFRRRVEQIVRGEAPLLAFMDESGGLRDGSLEDWHAAWPEAWRDVPANWYRAYFSTYLRECGVEGISVLAHAGHFDGSDFIYGSGSPVCPATVTEAVRPALAELVSDLRFKVRAGFAHLYKGALPLSALRDWTGPLRQLRHEHDSLLKKRKKILRSFARRYRDMADSWIQAELASVCPELAGIIRASRASGRIDRRLVGVRIESDVVVRVLDQIKSQFENDPAARVAVHNALCAAIRHARKKLSLECPHVRQIVPGPAPEASPFLAEHGLALDHVAILRDHLAALAKNDRIEVPISVRRCLALTVFGGFSDPEQVCRLSTQRDEPVVPAGADNGLLLKDGANTIGIRDEVALAFSSNETDESLAPTTVEDLGRMLWPYLPEALRGPQIRVLVRLCSTVEVANRYERSGLERLARSSRGSVDACADQQRAFLSRTLPPLSSVEAACGSPNIDLLSDAPELSGQGFIDRRLQRDREAYQVMLDAISRPHDLLARNGVTPSSLEGADRKSTLNKVVAALRLCGAASALPRADGQVWINDALLGFVDDMALHGTDLRKEPAVATLLTYVTSIGPELIEHFSGLDLRQLDAEDFLDAFESLSERKGEAGTQNRALAQCQRFYQCLERRFGFDPLPAGATREFQARQTDNRVPQLISEAEYLAALAILLSASGWEHPDATISHAHWRRACRQAAVALILLWHTGARLGEIARARFVDLALSHTWGAMLIRASLYQALKSRAARRLANLTGRLTPMERDVVLNWISEERARLGEKPLGNALLFCRLSHHRRGLGPGRIRALIQDAFKRSTGRHVWPHLIRHAWVSRQYPDAASPANPEGKIRSVHEQQRAMRTAVVEAGHVHAGTGAFYYLHDSWRLAATPATVREAYTDRWSLAFLAGESVALVDKVAQRRKTSDGNKPTPGRWVTWMFERADRVQSHSSPAARAQATDGANAPSSPLSPGELSELIASSSCRDDFMARARTFGLTGAGAEKIWSHCEALGRITNYRLVPIQKKQRWLPRTPVPREITSEAIDSVLSTRNPETAFRLGEIFAASYRPFQARHDHLNVPSDQAGYLADVMKSHGLISDVLPAPDGCAYVAFPSQTGVGLFHRVCSALAVLWVWARVV
ncbi:MAG: hypothetical protein ACT4PZ_17960 [Panacagrimonas sp.]